MSMDLFSSDQDQDQDQVPRLRRVEAQSVQAMFMSGVHSSIHSLGVDFEVTISRLLFPLA